MSGIEQQKRNIKPPVMVGQVVVPGGVSELGGRESSLSLDINLSYQKDPSFVQAEEIKLDFTNN